MEVLSGILTVKQPAVIKHRAYEKHWCTLFYGVKSLSPRIDIYDRDPRAGNANVSCKKTIYLESALWKKIDTLEPAFSFEVKNGKQYIFYCNSVGERQEWLLSLCCVSDGLFDTKHVVGVSNDGNISRSSVAADGDSVVINNSVYGGASEVQDFFVLADQTDGCLKLRWKGVFKLSIGKGSVKLSDLSSGACVVQWQITELKNYGNSSQTVSVHAGSRSSTGEGRFIFRTTESSKIVGCIDREAEVIQMNNILNSTIQKPNKKEEKRLKEEQKRIEKQVKEEQKQREKEEKRAQKERERKRKEFEKQQKKETRLSLRKASHADDPYSEPTDTSLQRLRVLQIPAEDEYAEAGDFPRPSEPKQQIEEKTYLPPWENTPLIPSASQPEERNNVDDIYAAPVKKKITKTKAQSEDSLNMGKDEPPPDLVRPTWDREGSSDDMASLYAQTNEVSKVTATDYGHIYGLGSASAEFVPKKENENIYDL